MKEEVKNLIQSVVNNNFAEAKKHCRIIVEQDKTQKDARFCDNILNKLLTQGNMIELPYNIQGLIAAEDVEANFNEKRYYISEREKDVIQKITTMTSTAGKLQDIGIRYLNSTLLYGKSGTGKTLFAKYIAYKFKLPFYYINFSHTIDSYLGGTGKNLHKIFDFVKGQKCVFMLDEVDSIGVKRGDSKEVGEINRIVIGLMQELDQIGNDSIIIAASNRLDILDEALRRRFSLEHEVKMFSADELMRMINLLLDDIEMFVDPQRLEQYVVKCEKKGMAQGVVMNDIIRQIAKAIECDTRTILL